MNTLRAVDILITEGCQFVQLILHQLAVQPVSLMLSIYKHNVQSKRQGVFLCCLDTFVKYLWLQLIPRLLAANDLQSSFRNASVHGNYLKKKKKYEHPVVAVAGSKIQDDDETPLFALHWWWGSKLGIKDWHNKTPSPHLAQRNGIWILITKYTEREKLITKFINSFLVVCSWFN